MLTLSWAGWGSLWASGMNGMSGMYKKLNSSFWKIYLGSSSINTRFLGQKDLLIKINICSQIQNYYGGAFRTLSNIYDGVFFQE